MSSTDGVICSLQEMEESKTPSDRLTIHCLTRGQTIGLVFSLEGAFLSLGVLLMLFVFILRNYLRRRHHHHDASSLLHLPTDVFVLSLLLFCLIYSLSNAVDVKWINEGKFYIGKPCMAQGLLHLIGDLGVPSNMLVIDIHTFSAIWWQNSHLLSVRAALIISCILWMTVCSFTMGFAAVNSGGGRIFACPTPISCTVSVQFTAEKHLESATLIWMWIVVIISIVIYIPLYLLRRGNITTDEKSWWKVCIHVVSDLKKKQWDDDNAMKIYPVAYTATILPDTITRWIQFQFPHSQESTTLSQDSIPTGITYFTQFVYRLCPVVLAGLYLWSRPELPLFRRDGLATGQGRAPSIHSEDLCSGNNQAVTDTEQGPALPEIGVEDADDEATRRLEAALRMS